MAFDNMAARPISETSDWQRHEVILDIPAEAQANRLRRSPHRRRQRLDV